MTLLNHSKAHRTYLKQAIEDWGALEITAGNITTFTVNVGSGGLAGTDISGTITSPIIYISEIQGCPYYEDTTGLLIVGYRIRFKITEVDYSEALEGLTKLYESLAHYIDACFVMPSVLGDHPTHTRIDNYWLRIDITKPYLNKVIDFAYKKESYLSNGLYFDLKIRTCNFLRSHSFPSGKII